VRPATACFEAVYAAEYDDAMIELTEAQFTIDPRCGILFSSLWDIG
jgi:hypothetical protein